jgi:hypothetical protein
MTSRSGDQYIPSAKRARHGDVLLKRMDLLKTHSQLCDIALRAEERIFRVHRVVMASSSDYFRAMLTNNSWRESTEQQIELKGVSAKGLFPLFQILVSFICTNNN